MNKKEFEKFWLDMSEIAKKVSIPQPPTMTSIAASYFHQKLSPTDKDAKGMFEYQRPERDEQGTFYGYKVLRKCCESPACDVFFSPRYTSKWINGELHADKEPSERSMHGIHFTKRPNNPELNQYYARWSGQIVYEESALVMCALSGTVVETEQGFRAEHAQIIGVLENGNWTSYQDYQERARSYSNQVTEFRTEWRFTYGKPPKGKGISHTYFDTSADS